MNEVKLLAFGRHFAWRPFLMVTFLCLVAAVLADFDGFGLLLFPALLIVAGLFLYWIVMIIRSLVLLRWRRLGMIFVLGIFEVCLILYCLRNGDEIHLQIMRPIYMKKILQDKSYPKIEDWDWGGGLNFEYTLVYVDGISIESSGEVNNSDGYKSTVKRLSKHFFVVYTTG